MEATVVSIGKSVLVGALGFARSKVAEEVALQLGVEGDVAFIADELEMMQSFLMTADEERGQHKVLGTWVKQVCDMAYNVEDSLMDFALYSEKKASWWCSLHTVGERRRIAKEVKELRAKVEDVSNRNLRYRLMKACSGSKTSAAEEQASIANATAAMFGINEARFAELGKEELKVDLHQLITSEEEELRVISVWGTSGDLGKTFAIKEVYDDPKVLKKFGFCAWIRLAHPFNAKEFIYSLVRQFYKNSHDEVANRKEETSVGANILLKMEKMKQNELVHVFNTQVSNNSYLIVINNLSTIEEWHCVKEYFPDNKKQSRIIVSTQQVEIASLCSEKLYQVSELKQLSCDQTIYLFHKKNSEEPASVAKKSLVIKLIGQPDNNQGRKVISVWGMGGLGKTTLVRSVYRSQQLGGWKRAWTTALRPFNAAALLRDLVLQLQKSIQEDPAAAIASGAHKKSITVMELKELKEELSRLLKVQKCLVVLDDISTIKEWELVEKCLDNAGRIIVTTREKNIAEKCSRDNMYNLKGLKHEAALDLFVKKVFKDNTDKNDLAPAMMEQATLVLKKCDGLPLAISTIGGFLSTKPRTAIEWRKMNDCISSELEINPELRTIKSVLMRSYDGLPYHLKSAFLYLSIFPEDHRIRWDRLVRRWIAEGYSRDIHGMTGEQLGRRYFDELFDRCVILPGDKICITKAREENLVFTLEEGFCLSSTQGAIRHLVVGSNWKRDKDVLESMLDLSHVRSLTVFGEWRPFFISDKMRFLRVLDLEDTLGLRDHHLDQIGQLRHLIYLSLRDCKNIFCLPNSLGNLRHLQTLDVRGTQIFELPATMTKLRKLEHLRTTDLLKTMPGSNVKGEDDIVAKYRQQVPFVSTKFCLAFLPLLYASPIFLRPQVLGAGLNRLDILNIYRFCMVSLAEIDSFVSWLDGVEVPGGIGKLKALQTLGFVNIARGKGKATLNEFKELTQLRKLEVTAVSDQNSKEFWSAIASHNQLRSLSVKGVDDRCELDGSLGEGLLPPSCLESLKLWGKLVRVTSWIHQLQNLSKLTLEYSGLEQDDAIQALGVLPNLAVLRLKEGSFDGKQLRFQGASFPSLVVLELHGLHYLESVLFEEEAMPRLELLQVGWCGGLNKISGLAVLSSLMEMRLPAYGLHAVKEEVKRQ
ncbi:hypothetical protein BRADI_2g38800v3, partial [Brachypodium distachyon]